MIDVLKDISNSVDNEIEKFYESGAISKVVKNGADGTPTHTIDTIAENIIVDYVKTNDIPCNILSEECGYIDRNEDMTLVVDPIDGTFNALNKIPFFSISLAISDKSFNEIEYGVVKNLATKDLYYCERGKGAYKNGKRLHVRKESDKKLGVINYDYASKDIVFSAIKDIYRIRTLGCASLEMLLVAEGIADLFFYIKNGGMLRNVVIAASTLTVREAGGIVLDEKGNIFEMPISLKERKNVVAVAYESLAGFIG